MKQIPFHYRMIRGAIGKLFVIKHYKGGRVVKTKYPDMSGIVPSDKQKERRNLFKEAVVYAQWIIADKDRKKAFRQTLSWKKRGRVYQAAIQRYMSMQGDKHWQRKQLAVKGLMRSSSGAGSTVNNYKQQESWAVVWYKRKEVVTEVSQIVDEGSYTSPIPGCRISVATAHIPDHALGSALYAL